MALGTGIFLSAFILSVVLLYNATKDRWRWRRILIWVAGLLVILPSLALVSAYVIERINDRPRAMESLWGIAIGSTMEDVLFLKGKPDSKLGGRWFYDIDADESDMDYVVNFGKTGRSVRYVGVTSGGPIYEVNGIEFGDSYESVIGRLGKPDYVSISEDGLSRGLSFKEYKMWIGLSKGEVEVILVSDGKNPIRLRGERKPK